MERFKNILDEKIKRSGIVTFCIVAVSIILSGSIIAFAAEKVAYQIEENLQIIERPTEKPQLTETPLPLPTENINYTAKPDNTYIEKDVNPKNENNENISSDDSYNKSDNNYSQPSYTETTVYEDDSTKTTDDNNSKADINIEIGEERENVYEKLGEPDSVSEDGSKEVYNLSDGNTAVLQYEDDVLGDGYILVE